MRAHSVPLAGGDDGIAQTIHAMNRLIDQGKKDPAIHEKAAEIIRAAKCPADYLPHGRVAAIRAIGEWVGRNIRYTPDVTGKETLHGATDVIRLGIGDCDDFTILICSMLGTIGVSCRIVTISSHSLDPAQFTHVFPEALAGQRWIPIDFARRNPRFGKGPERWARRRHWKTTSDEYEDVAGLAGYGGKQVDTAIPLRGYGGRPGVTARPMQGSETVRGQAPRLRLGGGLGYNPNALPGAYSTKTLPRFRRSKAIAPLGVGHYGSRALGVLAQDSGFDWSTLVPAITAATQGTANVIAAQRANPANLYPNVGQSSLLPPGVLSPYGTPYSSLYSASAFQTIGGIPVGTLILAGLGIAAIAVLKR